MKNHAKKYQQKYEAISSFPKSDPKLSFFKTVSL